MWSAVFWRDAGERAVKTFAQTLAALLAASVVAGVAGVDLLSVPWTYDLSISAGAALLSVLSSMGSARSARGGKGSPSLVD